ncbi:MAG: molybdopterin-dependent oxidoreductase [Pseudomonadota bacterium]
MSTTIQAPDTALTTCPYCGVGCGIQARLEDGRLTGVKGDKSHPANLGRLCVKGSALHETVDHDGRLLDPEIGGKPVDWDTALDAVAEGFVRIMREHGPQAVAFYVSGQLLTEDYYVANKLMKGYIGAANIDTNSRLCMASAVVGYKRAFGMDAVPCCYEDLEAADLIVLVGSNTAWAHPVVYQRIESARKDRPSMRVIVVDPRRTSTCDLADLHLPLKPGTDAVLFSGLLAWLAATHAIDRCYLDAHTEGFDEALVAAREWTPRRVAETCGLPLADVLSFFSQYADTDKVVTMYSQGVNQSSSGVDKSNAIINCHLATGRIGREGMGPFSITGQPNAMGGREVGGLANQLAAHMDFSPEDVERVQRFWGSPVIAGAPGLKAVDLFRAIGDGRVKAVWIMATNPVVSMPDADTVRQALAGCELVVVSDILRETDTTAFAHILLPATGWGEKDGTVTNSERRISRQRGILQPPGEARHDWWIITEVARRMGFAQGFPYTRPADIFREHAALSAFENGGRRAFDIGALADITDDQYDVLQPVQWPVTAAAPRGTQRLFADGRFFTPGGRARIIPITPRPPVHAPDARYPFVLNTGRVRDQWHTMTRTGKAARLLAHIDEPYCEIHPDDASRIGLADGVLARIVSPTGWMLARARVSQGQRPGSLFVPMHWNGQFASQARMGTLVAAVTDPLSGQPESKHGPARVEPWIPSWQAVLFTCGELDLDGLPYWVKVPGEDVIRHELAGTEAVADWRAWLDDRLAVAGVRLEAGDPQGPAYHAVMWADGRPVAALYVSSARPAIDREAISTAFREPPADSAGRLAMLAGRAPAGGDDVGRLVCSCFRVGEHAIHKAIEAGCTTAEALGASLKCGTNCGSCIPELKALIHSHAISKAA